MGKQDIGFKSAKASRWPPNVGNRCVEVKRGQNDVQVHDSKNKEGPVLVFTHDEWTAFLDGVGKREFDL